MDVTRISSSFSPASLGAAGLSTPLRRPGAAAAPEAGFAANFKHALKSVSAAQEGAARLQTQVQLGNPAVSLEETVLAMQKAQVGFQATLHVRNRMVQAYTDVMNMSV